MQAGIGFGERYVLLAAEPETFYVTDHYRNHPAILVRLEAVSQDQLREVLELAWRQRAPERLIAAFDGEERSGVR